MALWNHLVPELVEKRHAGSDKLPHSRYPSSAVAPPQDQQNEFDRPRDKKKSKSDQVQRIPTSTFGRERIAEVHNIFWQFDNFPPGGRASQLKLHLGEFCELFKGGEPCRRLRNEAFCS